MGDYPLWIYIAANSTVKCLSELSEASVYRMLSNSASHFEKLSQYILFENSATDVRLYFANKYNTNYLIPIIRIDALNILLDHSLRLNQRLPISVIFPFLKLCKDLVKMLIKFAMCQNKVGRFFVLRRIKMIDDKAMKEKTDAIKGDK